MIVDPNPRVAQPEYGRGLLEALPRDLLSRPAVFTQPEPWEMVSGIFDAGRTSIHFVTSMEHEHLRSVADSLENRSAVIGIGGGSAMDSAKYAAGHRGLPLVLTPSILSVDAAFTKAAGVREGSRVRYVGAVYPDHLLIDFELLQRARPVLNRAGSADVLSIFTALWDWAQAARRLGEDFEPAVAAEAQHLLHRLYAGAGHLRKVTDEGLRLLAELYVAEIRLCEMVGNSRPEEGSEHYLAYCVEKLTGRSYIHGQLVGLCIDLVGRYQGQDVSPVREFFRELDLDCSPGAVGLSRRELRNALLHMGQFTAEEAHLLPGVFHFREGIIEDDADALLSDLL